MFFNEGMLMSILNLTIPITGGNFVISILRGILYNPRNFDVHCILYE